MQTDRCSVLAYDWLWEEVTAQMILDMAMRDVKRVYVATSAKNNNQSTKYRTNGSFKGMLCPSDGELESKGSRVPPGLHWVLFLHRAACRSLKRLDQGAFAPN